MTTAKKLKKLVHETEHATLDVVCGMDIVVEHALCHTVYHNVTYYFCTHNCQQHFDANPQRYVGEKQMS